MLGNILRSLSSLIYGDGCIICGDHTQKGMHSICTKCRLEIPLTHFYSEEDNPVKERFDGFVAVEQASAMFFYVTNSRWQGLVHRFKYSGKWQIAYSMGRWYGSLLKESGLYTDIDVIVPVPLHPIKILKRGYNQSEHIAIGVSRGLGVKYDFRAVRRVSNTASQALTQQSERWRNMESVFKVRREQQLRGRHILIVDDVFTTGATTTSCIESIITACQGDVRISVATLAVSRRLVEEMSDRYDV